MKKMWIIGSQSMKTKFGKAEQTEDEEYASLSNKCKTSQKASEDFVKHVNQLVENFNAFSSTLTFLADDMRELNTENNHNIEVIAQTFKKVAQNVDTACVKSFQNNVTEQIVQPVNEYIVQFATLEKLHKEHKNLTLQLDYYRQQVQKLVEKPSKNPLDLPKAKETLSTFQEQYDNVSNQCKQEMLNILEKEGPLFEKVVPTIVANLLEWNNSNSKVMNDLKH